MELSLLNPLLVLVAHGLMERLFRGLGTRNFWEIVVCGGTSAVTDG